MKDNLSMREYLRVVFEQKMREMIDGENSNIVKVTPYGNAEIITFENGNKYRMEISKYTPEPVTLD